MQRLEIDKYERTYLILAVAMIGVFFAALIAGALIYGVRLPTADAFVNPILVDQTEFTQLGLRDMGDGNYEMYILAQMWQFNIGTDEVDSWNRPVMRVPEGARVTFHVTTRDVTHGFIIEHHNVNLELVPGHVATQTVTFDRAGSYHVVCHEYCGRSHHNMVMVVIVEPTS
jgi:cytochrome c oxidase subunit 2